MDKGKIGVLLVNLGTPDSPKTGDVRKYLREFLMDGRVIDINPAGRFLLVNGIIAPFRAPNSAKDYKELWTEKGSPIKFFSLEVERKLQDALGDEFVVKLAMRYQSPSVHEKLEELKQIPLEKLIVIPLFPQYASATSGSVHQKVMEELSSWWSIPTVEFVGPFFDRDDFIEAFAANGKKLLDQRSYDHILFSYHGLPERQIKKGDPFGVCKLGDCCDSIGPKNYLCYRAQCFATTRLLASALELKEGTYSTCFQSRLGKDPWLQPYTESKIYELRKDGIEHVLVYSPAFVADCLETTMEIGEEYRETWEEEGGKTWDLVPSLNDGDKWVEVLQHVAIEKAGKTLHTPYNNMYS